MRVLHCVGRMGRGGIETFVMTMLRNVDRSCLHVDLLCTIYGKGEYDDEARRLGAQIYAFDSGFYQKRTPIKQIVQLWYYINFFKKCDYDIYHFHCSHSFDAFIQLVAARLAGKHRLVFHSHTTSGTHSCLNSLFARFLGRAGVVRVACSDAAGAWLYGKGSSWVIVNNGINTAQFQYNEHIREAVRRELQIPEGTNLVIMVGRLVPVKNHSFMVHVMLRLLNERSDMILIVVGDGLLRQEMEHLAEQYRLGDCVRFLGMRGDIHRLMSAADCYVMPSLYEGLPVAGIEAQAAGLPCVFSDNVSREVELGCVSCRFLPVGNENIGDWAEELCRLSKIKGDRIGAAACVFDSGYDISVSVGRLIGLYSSMMER